MFLIHGAGQHHCGTALTRLLGQANNGPQHGRHPAFDIARAAAIDAAVAHHRVPRIDDHVVDRHRILVGLQQDQGPAFGRRNFAVDADKNVLPLGINRLPLPGQPQPLE